MVGELLGRRPGDRVKVRRVKVLERQCAACDDWFEVMHHRPDADYCRSNACKQRRRYARTKAVRGE